MVEATALHLVPARAPDSSKDAVAQSCRARGTLKELLIQPVLVLMRQMSAEAAGRIVMQRAARGEINPRWELAAREKGKVSAASLARWARKSASSGTQALADGHRGRQRQECAWHARALQLYNQPTRPAYATVAYWLREEGFADATEHLVRRYLKAAPSNVTETGKKRLGAHYYAQNIKPHVVRDNTVLPVGFVYEGDGHCCDVYVAHPATGRAFRPELTTWLDVRSGYVVAWWMSESESAQTTLFSLSQALVSHNHVPAYVHTDPGSGFKAKLISHEVTGFLVRFSIQPMLALPGNAKGKGLQEGWFRWFEERCGKKFETFCGHDRTDDFLRRLSDKVKSGAVVLPTFAQYMDAVRSYIEAYNRTPQDNLGCAPAELWRQLERVELSAPAEAVIRPRVSRTVRRWGVSLDNRSYRAAGLAAYESRDVIVEYSIHDDDRVWVHDDAGRFVCEAQLVQKRPWLPASRIEEGQQKRLEGQKQRHLRAIEEQEARAHSPLPHLQAPMALPLADGHSLAAPVAPRAMPAPALDARTAEILADLSAKPSAPAARIAGRALSTENEIAARFARAQQVEQLLASGDVAEPAEVEWLNRYRNTAEYRGQMRFVQAFNQPVRSEHGQG